MSQTENLSQHLLLKPEENFHDFLNYLPQSPLAAWQDKIVGQIRDGLSEQRYGDLKDWKNALTNLPHIQTNHNEFSTKVSIGLVDDATQAQREKLHYVLTQLKPWRKGPYFTHGIHIDTEWRSDWKWDRVLPHLASLKNKLILDVGCGNGYHCWRMIGEDAARVIGIDPSPRFVLQFQLIKFLAEASGQKYPIDVLPLGIEDLPNDLKAFDTVFSMGVLYHRRSPMDHLRELKDALKPGGQLVLETLIIDGKLGEVLVPEGRYAMMNNVWFLPSADTLLSWLRKSGFNNPRVVDINQTTTEEQRSTQWMHFHSLKEFLNKENPSLTAEGHPAPIRAVFVAES